MEKTRDLLKKIGDTKGIFHVKMGTIEDRSGKDLTEAEDIKKRWQEYWSGLPFPSPMHESESEVAQSCPTLSDPMDCSLPGSSVHGIFQASILEWVAIAFSMTFP